MSKASFSIILATDPAHDRVVAEIFCNGRFVALISEELAEGVYELETPGPNLVEAEICRRVDLEGFLAAVQLAKNRLRDGRPASD